MKSKLSQRIALSLAMTLLAAGCARINDLTMQVMATDVQTYTVAGNRVLSGAITLYTDRTGALSLTSHENGVVDCAGSLRYTSSTGGLVHLHCSDGLQTTLTFTALSETSGYARNPAGDASLSYGLPAEDARAWLLPPAGKKLVANGDSLRLQPLR